MIIPRKNKVFWRQKERVTTGLDKTLGAHQGSMNFIHMHQIMITLHIYLVCLLDYHRRALK